MRIFLTLGLMVLFASNLQAQLNDYKYVIIPKRFDNFKEENQHQTSTLVKHLFSTQGFNTVYNDDLPPDLYADSCLGLKAVLDDDSSMFTTKTKLILEDCNGQSVFISQEGRSREKDYKLSYKEAISKAFKSFEALNYTYSGKNEEETVTLSYKNDVKNIDEGARVEKTSEKTSEKPMIKQEATTENQSYESFEPKESSIQKGSSTGAVVSQVATVDEQSYEDKTPVASTVDKAAETSSIATKPENLGVLYAQELPSGFQLVDSSPKIVMTLFKTSMKDIYAAKYGSINGLVFERDGKWFFDYTEGQALIQKELNIKF